MLRFEATVDGLPVFDRAFNRLGAGVSDLRAVWPYVEDWFYRMEQRLFQSQGSTGAHGRWADNAPAYEEWKAKTYGPFTFPLYRTGALEHALGGKNRPHAVEIDDPLEFARGTDLDYAGYHMEARGRRPARRAIDPSAQDLTDLQKEIQRGLVYEVIRPAGFRFD